MNSDTIVLWDAVGRIQSSLSLDDSQFAVMLQLNAKEFSRLKNAKSGLNSSSVVALSDRLNVSHESLYSNGFDLKTLVRQYYDGADCLPEKYTRAALSKRRMSYAMLNFVEKKFGWQKRIALLRKLQMNESMWNDLDAPISGEIGYDILTNLVNDCQDEDIVLELGESSIHTHKHTGIGKGLALARNSSESYELATSEVIPMFFNKYDLWKLSSLHSDGCVISTVPNYHALLDQKVNLQHFVNPLICRINHGYLRTFTFYGGHAPVRTRKIACVNLGASECRYEVIFQKRRHPHLSLVDH